MKKILGSAASLALALSFSTAVPTAAHASIDDGNAKDVVGFCKWVASVTDYPQGRCVSFFRANEAPAICNLLDALGVLDAIEANRGNCVSYIRTLD